MTEGRNATYVVGNFSTTSALVLVPAGMHPLSTLYLTLLRSFATILCTSKKQRDQLVGMVLKVN